MRFRCQLALSLFTIGLLVDPLLGASGELETSLRYHNITDIQISPDGTRAVFAVTDTDLRQNANHSQLWITDLQSGKSKQLTDGPQRSTAPRWSPDGSKIAFLSARRGPSQIWTVSPDSGEAEQVARVRMNMMQFRWLPDGSGFVFLGAVPPQASAGRGAGGRGPGGRPSANPIVVGERPQFARLYRLRLGEDEPELLMKEDYHVMTFDVSPLGNPSTKVALSGQARPGHGFSMESHLKTLDLGSGNVNTLVTRLGPLGAPQFSPDSQWIGFISQEGQNNMLHNRYLQVVRSDGSEVRNLSRSVDEHVESFEWGVGGKEIFFHVLQRVSSTLYRAQADSTALEKLDLWPELSVCYGFGLVPRQDSPTVVAILADARTPAEVYLLDREKKGPLKLTQVNDEFIGTAPSTEVIRYPSSDGFQIEGLLVKPKHFRIDYRHPLLVIVHGGPPGVFNHTFYPRRGPYPIFAFAERGYMVLLPNPRGSGAYGERFRQANRRDLGGGDYQDIMAGVDYLIERGYVDSERMGMMGWSYGGFMSYWAATHTNRFKAISAGAGITNLYSHHGTAQAKGFGLYDSVFGVTPWEDPTVYLEHSPIQFVRDIKTPLLIQHGERDPTVPLTQAHEFYAAAQRVGATVEMVIYPRQGHAIRDPRLSLAAMKKNLAWFDRWVLGKK